MRINVNLLINDNHQLLISLTAWQFGLTHITSIRLSFDVKYKSVVNLIIRGSVNY